jgi:hypothetical protein
MLRRSAILTRSANDRARIFRMMLPRCIFTVTTLIPSSAAICLFRSPEVTKLRISFSRAVSDANWLFRTVTFLSSLTRSIAFNCKTNRVKQFLVTTRLGQEFDGPRFHRLHGHRNITMASHEDNGQIRSRLCQFALELKSAEAGQPDIEYQAASDVRMLTLQKVVGRIEQLDVQTDRPKETL